MDIRHGLISADSHVITERDAFLERMSKNKFGERIPQIQEVENNKGPNMSMSERTGDSFLHERQARARCAGVLSEGNQIVVQAVQNVQMVQAVFGGFR
jgi:hypothetical protein